VGDSGRPDAKAGTLLARLDDLVRPVGANGTRCFGVERVIVLTEYRDTQRRNFNQLEASTQQKFLEALVPVVVIDGVDTPDKIRDLFIRLQAGTALTRQQVRDAWPREHWSIRDQYHRQTKSAGTERRACAGVGRSQERQLTCVS
jgi:hypothetical protein